MFDSNKFTFSRDTMASHRSTSITSPVSLSDSPRGGRWELGDEGGSSLLPGIRGGEEEVKSGDGNGAEERFARYVGYVTSPRR